MSKIEHAIKTVCQAISQKSLLIAYSGGVDSQVLLHAVAKLIANKTITQAVTVCHVNHGLSENAKQWQDFAQQQCKTLNLPFISQAVSLDKHASDSLEALAREARYHVLKDVAGEHSAILTGHHGSDQAETFLLALKRGAGLKGLSAMKTVNNYQAYAFVRPLLECSRADILSYASEHQLQWIEDESNADCQFDRNFIRHDVMPMLAKRWPSIENTIARSAQHCQEGQLLLEELAQQDLAIACENSADNALDTEFLARLSQPRFNNLLRYYLQQFNCLMPSTEQLRQVFQQLAASDDKSPEIKVGDHVIRRFKQRLYVTPKYSDISTVEINLTDIFEQKRCKQLTLDHVLPDGLGTLFIHCSDSQIFPLIEEEVVNKNDDIAKDCLFVLPPEKGQKVTLRFSHDNPTCLPSFRNKSRTLKKVLQELHIPPWQRRRLPFIYYDDVFVGIVGYFICQPFTPVVNDKKIALKIVR